MSLKGKCAIAGVGITEMGKVYGRTTYPANGFIHNARQAAR